MAKVIDQCYGGNVGCDEPLGIFDSMTRIYQIEQQLNDWVSGLPLNLRPRQSQKIPSEDETDLSEKARILLTLHYHNLRILLHRPILMKFLDVVGKLDCDSNDLAQLQQIGTSSIGICLSAAMEIISIIKTLVNSDGPRRGDLGAWWFSLYYGMTIINCIHHSAYLDTGFNAALIIFAALLIQHSGKPICPWPTSASKSRKCFDDAVEALSLLDRGNELVEKCTLYLKQSSYDLDTLICKNRSQNRTSNGLHVTPPNDLGADAQPPYTTIDMSPFGTGLGEFMLEGDEEFLTNLFIPTT
ncbi:MAG: hypothetical protein M1819_007358 [Sarea resinae]|nr:MAG: hypothetical protein M1819_007358 [Sarea resinae]